MRFGPRADGRADRAHGDAVRAEGGGQKAQQARGGHEARGRRPVAGGLQNGQARQVLRGHGDDKEGNAQADRRLRAEGGRRPYEFGQAPVQLVDLHEAHCGRHGHCHGHHHQHGVARRPAAAQQVGGAHGQHQRGLLVDVAENAHAEIEQHASQHGGGDLAGNAAQDGIDPAEQSARERQAGCQHEGAHGFIEGNAGQRGDQQRRAGRGPRHDHGQARAQAVERAAQAQDEAQRADPRADARRVQAGCVARLHHQHGGAAETDQDGDQPRSDRGRGEVASGVVWGGGKVDAWRRRVAHAAPVRRRYLAMSCSWPSFHCGCSSMHSTGQTTLH